MAFNKNRVMESARRYVEKGQVDKAIKEYLRVVREDPKDVRVWLKIGDLYAKKGAKAEATETYLKVAKFYSEQGFYLKAVAVYKQILKLDPRLIEVNLKLAELYRQLGLMSDAMRHFEMVAGHFHREGKTKEALATVRQLVDLDPENVATRIKLAELYSKEGMVEEAITEFTNACEYLRANSRQDDFVKVAERLLWHKPDNIALSRELAALYLRRNDPRRALQKLQICFKANSRDVETLALLAQAFQALEQKSKTVQVLKELARVLDEDGERERAKEVHRKILAFMPNETDSLAYLGQNAGEPSAPPPEPVRPPRESPVQRLAIVASQDPPDRRRHNPTGSLPLVMDGGRMGVALSYGDPIPAAPAPEDFASELTEDVPYEASVSAERHSEEIAKILTETDVYVKYGLHQKAIDHLRRVFELDRNNIEARERLKEVFLEQSREDEAIAELMRMAEITAPRDPDRAEAYLREILAINATYQPVFALARRFHILLGEAMATSAQLGLQGGEVTPIDDDIDFGDIEFDDGDGLVSDRRSGVQARGYGAPAAGSDYELDFDAPPLVAARDGSAVTMEISVDEVESMFDLLEEEDGEDLDFDVHGTAGDPILSEEEFDIAAEEYVADNRFSEPPVFDPEDARAFDAATFGGGGGNKAAAARGPGGRSQSEDYGGYGYGEPAPTSEFQPPDFGQSMSDYGAGHFDAEPLSDIREYAGDFESADEYFAAVHTTQVGGRPGSRGATVQTGIDVLDDKLIESASADREQTLSGLDDDLEEADFFIAQGLFSEARDIIHGLMGTHPGHPLLLAKLQDISGLERGTAENAFTPVSEHGFPQHGDRTAVAPGPAEGHRPSVMLENPVDDEDADTHFDLGLAYKEMGLYGDAIKAFSKITDAAGREVQSRLMIGLCYREQSNMAEAIQQFKAGLHAPGIVELEQLSLYYEIATTYELLGDPKEAMYFYELIRKRDPGYRDVRQRMSVIHDRLSRSRTETQQITLSDEDPDDILDSLLIETDRGT